MHPMVYELHVMKKKKEEEEEEERRKKDNKIEILEFSFLNFWVV